MKSIVASPNPVLINGFEYGWSNMAILINGLLPTIGITAIDYTENGEIVNLLGFGNTPIARGVGNYTYEASITLYKSEIIALQNAARAQNPLNTTGTISGILPFDIVVSYMRPDGSGITTDILKDVQFTNNKSGGAQGDTSLTTELTLVISQIVWGS